MRRLLLAAASTGLVLTAAAPALAAAPAPVTHLQLKTSNATVTATWWASPDTPYADVCWAVDVAPTAPGDAGATCSGNVVSSYTLAAAAGTTYGVSVFAVHDGDYSPPTSATITAIDEAPGAPFCLSTEPRPWYDGSQCVLMLSWFDDPTVNTDVRDYVVNWAKGTDVPPADPDTGVVVQGHFGRMSTACIADLTPGDVYTFAVRVRDEAMQLSQPGVLRAATRTPDITYLRAASAGATPKIYQPDLGGSTDDPGSCPCQAGATMTASGHLRMAYRADIWVGYTSTVSGYHPLTVNEGGRPLIDASAHDVFVAWGDSYRGVLYMTRIDGTWSKRRTLSTARYRSVLGVTFDGSNAHVLVRWTKGLRLFSYVGGSWHATAVTGTTPSDAATLTRDQATNRVVIVDRHRPATSGSLRSLRVATMSPKATTVSGWRTWWSTSGSTVDLVPTSVASSHGIITVAEQRVSTAASSADGPYVQQGSATSHRRPVRVAGTGPADSEVVVTALQHNRAVIGWRRLDSDWSPDALGIWSQELVRHTDGSTTFAHARRWTTSAYDEPVGVFRDDSGRYSVVFTTTGEDVAQ
jgi:hypothetical protein